MMTYFVTTTKGSLVEELARIFKNNMWKLHRLSESVVLNRRPQFVVELTKELNSMLGIMIVMIYTSCLQVFALCWTCTGVCLIFNFLLNYILPHPHIVLVSISCSSKGFLIFSSLFSQECITYSLWLIGIYSSRYNHVFLCFTNWSFLYSYSSLCPSCNLSQA